jgi:putative ABC transport system permease protein
VVSREPSRRARIGHGTSRRARIGHGTLHVKVRRDIRRQWAQAAALVLTVLLGVALFAASYDAYGNLRDSYAHVFAVQRFADLWADTDTPARAGRIAARLADAPGVQAVAVRTQADLPIRIGADALPGRVVGIPTAAQPEVDRVTVLSGDYPTAPDQVAVEQHLADHFHLRPGSAVEVRGPHGWHRVSVTAVVSSAEYLWPARSRQEPLTTPENFGVVFAPQPLLDAVAPQAPGQVQVLLTDSARSENTVAALSAQARALGATSVTTRAEQSSNSLLQEDINGFADMSYLFPLLFLGAAGMSAYVLLTRRVDAEREVIGMLLACGVSRRTVLAHYLGYGLALGAVGGLLGVAVGEGLARVVSRTYLQAINLPQSLGVLSVARPGTIVTGLSFGILVGVLSALAPALAASRMAPAQAMRGVQPARATSRSLLERMVPPLRHAPVTVRLVLRGVGRNRRRTTFTAVGVVLSLLVILTSWTMLDTMTAMLNVQFDHVSRQDAQVSLAGPADASALDALRAVPGVAQAEPLAQVAVTLRSGDRSYPTAAIGLPTATDLHGFRLADGGTTTLAALAPGSVLLGQGVRDRLGVTAGSALSVIGPDGVHRTVRVSALLDEPMGTYLYAPLSRFDTVTGTATPTSALIRLSPGADRTTVRRAVTGLPMVVAYQDSQTLKRSFDALMGLFTGIIGAMLVLGCLMAFAIIFTTMSVNIIERHREIASLRTGGVRHRAIAALVAGENLLTTLLGVVPGLALGVLGGKAYLASYSNDQMRFDLVVRPTTLIVSAAAILAVAALSQWPGLRAVSRLDLAQAVRERSG